MTGWHKSLVLAAAVAVAILPLLWPQTRIHGPTQVRDLASGGGAIAWYYGPLSFGTLVQGQCSELQFPAPGASPGLSVAPGWPADLTQGVTGIMYSGDNVVIVRLCAISGTRTIAPATYSAAIPVWR